MSTQIWTIIGAIATGLLVPITGALGIWGAAQVKRWQAKTDLKTMKQNAMDAVQAIEQLYPNENGEAKKKLALTWAAHLNTVAGITATPETLNVLNESSVLTLPPTCPPVINDPSVSPDPTAKG
jgi:hypothetical protein